MLCTLTILDTVSIQSYVFGSNVLRENVGASHLIHLATRVWPLEIIHALHVNNVELQANHAPPQVTNKVCIECQPEVRVEVVYAGGGNCVFLTRDSEQAKAIVQQLSLRLLREGPGIDLVAAHVPFDWDTRRLSEVTREAFRALATTKAQRQRPAPMLGLSVTAACRSTGLPAVGTDCGLPPPTDDPVRILSSPILAELSCVEAANQRLERVLDLSGEYTVPREFDQLGRSRGDSSYLGVVHADGNGMGKLVEGIADNYKTPAGNRAYMEHMRAFSAHIERGSEQALQCLTKRLLDITKKGVVQTKLGTGENSVKVPNPAVALSPYEQGVWRLPFRPLVFGGDDLTMVCEGRLALGMAVAYLQEFGRAMRHQAEICRHDHRKKTYHIQLAKLRACAGVSIVKVHYPFARAYELAEQLCKRAKKTFDRQATAIDWHITASGLFGEINEILAPDYAAEPGDLSLRPLWLTHASGKAFHPAVGLGHFEYLAKEFITQKDWGSRSAQRERLRLALRQGEDATRSFCAAGGVELPPLERISEDRSAGWMRIGCSDRCLYYDALEALDFWTPLPDGKPGRAPDNTAAGEEVQA